MSGVEATVMGLGFLGRALGLAGTIPVMLIGASGLASSVLSALSLWSISAASLASVALASAGFPLGSNFLPRISAAVAAATSRAGIISTSSGGAGSFTGSGWPGFLA